MQGKRRNRWWQGRGRNSGFRSLGEFEAELKLVEGVQPDEDSVVMGMECVKAILSHMPGDKKLDLMYDLVDELAPGHYLAKKDGPPEQFEADVVKMWPRDTLVDPRD